MSQHLNSMLGENGDCPMIGDNDDSRHLTHARQHTLHQIGCSIGLSLSQYQDALLRDIRFALGSARRACLSMWLSQESSYLIGGISQLKHQIPCLIDHGALGYERLAARPCRYAFRVGFPWDTAIWVDFGSYSYADSDWRTWARSTQHTILWRSITRVQPDAGGFGWKTRALSVVSRDSIN